MNDTALAIMLIGAYLPPTASSGCSSPTVPVWVAASSSSVRQLAW